MKWRIRINFSLFVMALFSACTRASPWTYEEILSSEPAAQLAYISANPFQSLQLKFLSGSFGTVAYLSTTQGIFSSSQFMYIIDQQQFTENAHLLSGKQTLLLTEETTQRIISAFREHKSCEFFADNFYCEVVGDETIALLDNIR